MKAQEGGCLYLLQTSINKNHYQYKISNSQFFGCEAITGSGGALYINNIENLTIEASKFSNNTSPLSGGAIYYFCDLTGAIICNLTINMSSSFIGNYAGV